MSYKPPSWAKPEMPLSDVIRRRIEEIDEQNKRKAEEERKKQEAELCGQLDLFLPSPNNR